MKRILTSAILLISSAPAWAEQPVAFIMAAYASDAPAIQPRSLIQKSLKVFENSYRRHDQKIECTANKDKFIWAFNSEIFEPSRFFLVVEINQDNMITFADWRLPEEVCENHK